MIKSAPGRPTNLTRERRGQARESWPGADPYVMLRQQEEMMKIFAIVLFALGLGTFTGGVIQESLLDMALGTCALLLALMLYPNE